MMTKEQIESERKAIKEFAEELLKDPDKADKFFARVLSFVDSDPCPDSFCRYK